MAYTSLPTDELSEVDFTANEEKGFLYQVKHKSASLHQSRWRLSARVATLLNLVYTISFIIITSYVRKDLICVPGPPPPWSPLRNAGVVRNINTAYKPEKIFQSETSDEVEAAWGGWIQEHDHLVLLPINETKSRLPITIDAYLDPGYAVYGLAVYHQVHCLDYIRKAFYGNRFFPNHSREEVTFHKNHCFDMIRQAILCHADISLMHWWNRTYSYVDDSGRAQLTDHYLNLTPLQRTLGASGMWDTQVQCRDLEPINAWAKARRLDDGKYNAA